MPKSVLRLLQDEGSVQTLDGAPHRHRKQMFMAMMTPQALGRMDDCYRMEWKAAFHRWNGRDVVLHDETVGILAWAGTGWAGIPLAEEDVDDRTRELAAMVEHAGGTGPANWWAQHLRHQAEQWWQTIIQQIRNGTRAVPPGSAADLIASHRDENGQLLDQDVAAVELLNVVRPIVAVARFVTFAALALQQHPQWRESFASGDAHDLEPLSRRSAASIRSFRSSAARCASRSSAAATTSPRATGCCSTSMAPTTILACGRIPKAFRPQRFRARPGDPDTLIPQGAGACETGHRCPGEWLTIAILKEAVRQLAHGTRYDVPAQDLTIALTRMPTLPETGFIIRRARSAIQ